MQMRVRYVSKDSPSDGLIQSVFIITYFLGPVKSVLANRNCVVTRISLDLSKTPGMFTPSFPDQIRFATKNLRCCHGYTEDRHTEEGYSVLIYTV